MSAKKLMQVDRLFPLETVAQRMTLLNRFWAGEDIGRPIFLVRSSLETNGADPETRVRSFVARLEAEAKVPWDVLPCFDCGTYPVGLATAFGGRVVASSTGANPWIEPVVHQAEDVYRLKPPGVLDGMVGEKVQDYQYALERVGGYIPPRVPDMQGPLMVAAMLWKEEDFILAMYDKPEAVHHLLNLATDHIIAVYHYFRDTYPGALMVSCPVCYMPQELGVGMTEDFMHLLSPALYAEFGLPYVNRIAREFGGLLIHCCGVFKQHWDTVKQFHNLRGLDTQYPYSHPDEVFSAFPNIVHSMSLDYAESQRNFSTGDPDAFLKFLIEHTPRQLRWQIWANADDLAGLQRQMQLVQSRWT
jgi:hypothetical protein